MDKCLLMTGWCLEHEWICFPYIGSTPRGTISWVWDEILVICMYVYIYISGWGYIGNLIIPTDELIFFRGVGQPPSRWFSQLRTSIYCVISSGISQPATFDETGGDVLTWVVKTRWYPGDLTRIAGEWMQMDVPHESQYIYIYIRYHTIVNQRSWVDPSSYTSMHLPRTWPKWK